MWRKIHVCGLTYYVLYKLPNSLFKFRKGTYTHPDDRYRHFLPLWIPRVCPWMTKLGFCGLPCHPKGAQRGRLLHEVKWYKEGSLRIAGADQVEAPSPEHRACGHLQVISSHFCYESHPSSPIRAVGGTHGINQPHIQSALERGEKEKNWENHPSTVHSNDNILGWLSKRANKKASFFLC